MSTDWQELDPSIIFERVDLQRPKERAPLSSAGQDRPSSRFDRSYAEGLDGVSFYGRTYAAQVAQVRLG